MIVMIAPIASLLCSQLLLATAVLPFSEVRLGCMYAIGRYAPPPLPSGNLRVSLAEDLRILLIFIFCLHAAEMFYFYFQVRLMALTPRPDRGHAPGACACICASSDHVVHHEDS